MDELPIGRRVAYWRSRRHMSQQVFADRMGKSKSWVDKVERGVRRLDKFSVLHEIADVLHVDVQLLLGRDVSRSPDAGTGVDQVEVQEIRSALERYDQISAFFYPPSEPPPLDQIVKSVSHAWQTYERAKYPVLARALPGLLRKAQAADTANAQGRHAREAAHLLGQVYQISSAVLRKLGEYELSWLAADRSIAVSQRADDPLLAGTAAYRVSLALLALGRARPALEVNLNIANRLAPAGPATKPEQISVYGVLLLAAALAAARLADAASVRDLLVEAGEAAEAVGDDHDHYWTSFGPTNVHLHRVAALVELGEGRLAVEVGDSLDRAAFDMLVPERKACFHLDMARALAQGGDIVRAGEMLLEAYRIAPAEMRCRPVAHQVLADVARRARGVSAPMLTELGVVLGVAA